MTNHPRRRINAPIPVKDESGKQVGTMIQFEHVTDGTLSITMDIDREFRDRIWPFGVDHVSIVEGP